MLLYIVSSIVIFFLILRAYIKIKFHFWSAQPVFHIYDLHHWLRPNRVIDSSLPTINKYVDIINIRTVPVDKMCDDEVSSISSFIKNNYLRNKEAEYVPEEGHIMEYLKGTNQPSYVSIYRRPTVGLHNSNQSGDINKINEDLDIFSVITARILHITLKSVGSGSFPIYYVDNLCVNPAMRKKGIAPKAIQTLHYHLRHKNENVKTFLFKREGEMTAIVPLTTFTTRGYDVSKIPRVDLPHASMNVIEVTSKSLALFVDLIQKQRDVYECVIVPELTNIANMIAKGVISVRGILENGELIAVYIFRDSATIYGGERAVELVCSMSVCHFNEIYYAGFTIALASCCQEWKAASVIIDGVGGNDLITSSLGDHGFAPFLSSPSAFFLYNYASYTLPANKCFLFC